MDIYEKKNRFDEAYLKVYEKHKLTRKEALGRFHLVIEKGTGQPVKIVNSGEECSFIKECNMLYRFCFHFE